MGEYLNWSYETRWVRKKTRELEVCSLVSLNDLFYNIYMGRKKIEVNVGDKYGRLTILKEVQSSVFSSGQIQRRFECICECGNTTIVQMSALRNNNISSCGCYRKERITKLNITHGLVNHELYPIWKAMIQRCTNPNCKAYKYYGAKGIIVCDRWLNSFELFLNDVGERPVGYTIDRINVYGNYEPSNIRWATWKEQANNKTNNKSVYKLF